MEAVGPSSVGTSKSLLAWLGFWMLVAGLVVLPHISAYTHLSPHDELAHVDYVDKAQRFELVNGGELLGQTAMREQACRGHDLPEVKLPPCRTEVFEPRTFPERGFNTAYADPPLYYYVTAAVARVAQLLPGIDGLVISARAVGVVWLGAGLGVTFLLALALGASRLSAVGTGLLIASTPAVVHPAATVTSDAPALLAGGALCLLAIAVVRQPSRWWWLLPGAALATGIKATAVTVVGAVVVFLAMCAFFRQDRNQEPRVGFPGTGRGTVDRRLVFALVGTIVCGLLPLATWAAVTSVTAFPEVSEIPMRRTFHVSSLAWRDITGNALALASPAKNGYLPPFMLTSTMTTVMGLVDLLLIVSVAAMSWFGAFREVSNKLAVATLTSLLVSAPAFIVLIFLTAHNYVALPSRYGLSLVPALAACLALVASRRPAGGWVLLAFGLLSMGALLSHTLTEAR